ESGSTSDKVYFCAYVTLGLEDGSQVVYRIVGGDETDAGKQWISIESPVAKALLGRGIDDEVSVRTPNGEVTYVIEDIRY
ncbi:MAG: GreA/GreB family elongation factor, partial [Gammaproteobacteria bacterium]|nr:GreA/GreB family elongation factor [Gammaproteobacteria bacterium]